LENLNLNDEGFNTFTLSLLADLLDDLGEAIINVNRYNTLLANGDEMNISMYGPLLNDALKIKGSARDRVIKILSQVGQRVKTKEIMVSDKGSISEWDEKELASMSKKIRELANKQKANGEG